MFRKLAVPFLVASLAAFGCSSSSSGPHDGAAGHGGSGGAGGHAGGGGTGGSAGTGGTGGSAGSGGVAGSSAGDGGPSDGSSDLNPDVAMLDCNVTDSTGTDVLSAQVFCENLLAYCSNVSGFTLPAGYTTQSQCVATYMARSASLQHCQSYHLCWGVEGITNASPASPMVHCQHAVGLAVCVPPDGSAGN
jgi:hypothetical protein